MLAIFGAGLVAGAVVTGVSIWLIGRVSTGVPHTVRLGIVAGFGLLVLARDLKLIHLSLPQNPRQVPRAVFAQGRTSAAMRFGFELGTGVRTYMPAGGPYIVAAGLIAGMAGWSAAVLAGVGFGIGRAAMPLCGISAATVIRGMKYSACACAGSCLSRRQRALSE